MWLRFYNLELLAGRRMKAYKHGNPIYRFHAFTVKQHTPKMAIVLAWPALKFSKFDDSKS